MTRLPLTRAAAGLLRALLSRLGNEDRRISLSGISTIDWRSLTLEGERHQIVLRLTGDDANERCDRLTAGLEDAEFAIPGQIVADITVAGAPVRAVDGSYTLTIEALTITE